MNLRLLRYISNRIAHSTKRERFLNFARAVALISVMLGSMALIISLSALNGFETVIEQKAVDFTSHLVINDATFEPMKMDNKVLTLMPEKFSEIKAVAPVLKKEGLIRTKMFVEGVLIKGTNKKYDINNMKKNIISGTFDFTTDTSREVVIGEGLARKLGVGVGDTVVLFAIQENKQSDFYPEIDNFTVSGIYRTGMAKYDDIMIFIPFREAEKFFKMKKGYVDSYEVMLKDISDVKYMQKKIEDFLGFPYFCTTVYQLHSSIFAWIELQKAPIPIVLGLISIVAVFNIVTILLITVVEKTHSIGILRAIGMRNRGILSIFVFQGTSIGLAGTLAGCGLGLILGLLQQHYKIISLNPEIYFIDKFPIAFEAWHFLIVIGVSLFLSFLSTLVPSFIATRIKPINAIRFK